MMIWCTDFVSGFGVMNNTNKGWGVRAGDFITTPSTKAIETVDWDVVIESVEYYGQRFKVYLAEVVYTSA